VGLSEKIMELSRKVIILVSGRAFSFLLSLTIPLVLTRILAKEDYGSYQQLVMIYATVQAILLFGMPQSLLYYFPRKDQSEHPLLIKQTWAILFLSALSAITIFWIGAEVMKTSLPNHHLRSFIFLLGIYIGLMLLVQPIQNLLVLENKEIMATWSMIGFTIIDITILPVAAWYNPTTLGMVHGIVLTATIKLVMVLFYVYQNYLSQTIVGTPYYRDQLVYGIPVGLSAMIYVINVSIDKYMVGLFFSSSVFAIYYLGSLWPMIFGWVTQSAAQVVTPQLSKAHNDKNFVKMQSLYRDSVDKLIMIFLPATVLLALIAKPLIVTLFTEKYEASVPIFTIYLALLPSYSLNLRWILMASGQTKFLLRLAILMSAINATLSYVFLTTLDGDNRLLGIPVATVAVTWLSTLVVMYKSITTLESSLAQTYHWKRIFTTFLLSVVSGIPAGALLFLELPNLIFLIAAVTIYSIVFLYVSSKFKLWGDNEIKLIKSFLPFKS